MEDTIDYLSDQMRRRVKHILIGGAPKAVVFT